MVTVDTVQHLDSHSQEPNPTHLSTPACISQIAHVWRSVCGVIVGQAGEFPDWSKFESEFCVNFPSSTLSEILRAEVQGCHRF